MKTIRTIALLALSFAAVCGEAETINWNFLDQTEYCFHDIVPGQSAKTENCLISTAYAINFMYECKLYYPEQTESMPYASGTHDLHAKPSHMYGDNFKLAVVEPGTLFSGEGADNSWLDLEGMPNENLPRDFYLGIVINDDLGDRYGWMQLRYDQDCLVTLVHQAIDVDGDAILVGAIPVGAIPDGAVPEPTGAMLLLVGSALLLIRRRS